MTRKDYELIANAIRAVHPWSKPGFTVKLCADPVKETVDEIALAMADALANDNPRFDRAKFLSACGL